MPRPRPQRLKLAVPRAANVCDVPDIPGYLTCQANTSLYSDGLVSNLTRPVHSQCTVPANDSSCSLAPSPAGLRP